VSGLKIHSCGVVSGQREAAVSCAVEWSGFADRFPNWLNALVTGMKPGELHKNCLA